MSNEQEHKLRVLMDKRIVDMCLVFALLLVLSVSWQDSPSTNAGGLKQAAREALARQVGARPSDQPVPGIATRQATDERPPANDGVNLPREPSNQEHVRI